MILFSYKGKHLAPTDRKYLKSALPLLLGMLVCMVCLAGTTWAWFTASTSSGVQVIQSAAYSVEVNVSYEESEGKMQTVSPDDSAESGMLSYTSSLAANTNYTVTLKPTGTASKGYCILVVDGAYYYTETLPEGGLTFTYRTGSSVGSFQISWYWGTYPDTKNTDTSAETVTLLSNDDTVGKALTDSPAAETDPAEDAAEMVVDGTSETGTSAESTEPTATTYTVESGDTLSGIASKLGTTAEKLAAYNGIKDMNSIQAGQVLQIPPADYEVPKVTDTTAPAEDETEPVTEETASPDSDPTDSTAPSETTVETEAVDAGAEESTSASEPTEEQTETTP